MGIFDFFRRSREHAPDESTVREKSMVSSQMQADDGTPDIAPMRDIADPEITKPQEPRITHEVEADDTLWQIAQRYYGEGSRWREIYQANDDVLEDPNDLEEGLVLRIPFVTTPA